MYNKIIIMYNKCIYLFILKRTSSKLIECKSKRDTFFFFFFFFKNRIRIESTRVRGSNKDGRYVFLAIS